MPFGLKPECCKCGTDTCEIWHRNSEKKTVCNECHLISTVSVSPSPLMDAVQVADKSVNATTSLEVGEIMNENIDRPNIEESIAENETSEGGKTGAHGLGTRSGNYTATTTRTGKSLAGKKPGRGRHRKPGNGSKVTLTKGRGRRAVFKKQPMKAPSSVSSVVTTGYLFHQGIYYQVGDIISVIDDEDGRIYYAQIRGLLQDQYCEKSAVLTWLLPTQNSPPPEKGFDPLTYILGPEEELPRKLEYLEFVMHSPNDYFKLDVNARTADEKEAGFIWTNMGPIKRTIQT